MARYTNPLDNIKVAAPCSADWDAMVGNDQARFCGQCKMNVYNLSGMTREDAENLVRQTEGRLCVRFYQRTDGTIITDNCPVGLQAIKRRVSKIAAAVASTLLSFFAGLGIVSYYENNIARNFQVMGQMEAPHPPKVNVTPEVKPPIDAVPVMGEPVMGEPVMGRMAVMGKMVAPQSQNQSKKSCTMKKRASLPVLNQNR
jgi:hypothetical protein